MKLFLFFISFSFVSFSQKNDTLLLKMSLTYNEKNEVIYKSAYEYDKNNNLIGYTNNDLIYKIGNSYLANYDSLNNKQYEILYQNDSIGKLVTDSIIYNRYEIIHFYFDHARKELKILTTKLDSNNLSIYENTKTINSYWNTFNIQSFSENSEQPIKHKIISEFTDSIFRDKNGNEILRKTFDVLGMYYPYNVNGTFTPKQNLPNTLITVTSSKWNNGKLIVSTKENSLSQIEFEDLYFFDDSNKMIKHTTKNYRSNPINVNSYYYSYSEKNNLIIEKNWTDNSDSYQIRIYKKSKINLPIENGSYLNDGTLLSKTINKYKADYITEIKEYYYNKNILLNSGKTKYIYSKVKLK